MPSQESPLDFGVLQKYMDSRILRDEERKFFKKIDQRAQEEIAELQNNDYLRTFFTPSVQKVVKKILSPTKAPSAVEFQEFDEDGLNSQTQDRIRIFLTKLRQSWPQFTNIGNRKTLGRLLRDNTVIRYGSVLHKLFFDQDGYSLYPHLSLEYFRQVIRHKFIPKVYVPQYQHSFDSYLKYLQNKRTLAERKRKFQYYKT